MLHASKNGGRRKILAFCVILAQGNNSEKKAWVEEKTIEEGLDEGLAKESREKWCISPAYAGINPRLL